MTRETVSVTLRFVRSVEGLEYRSPHMNTNMRYLVGLLQSQPARECELPVLDCTNYETYCESQPARECELPAI